MYDNWHANAAVAAATAAAVSLAVLIHYEGLVFLSGRLQRHSGPQRIKVLYAMASTLGLHVAEIWVFGMMFWLLLRWPDCGHVALGFQGTPAAVGLFDAIYLSAITYTTVGFGDLVPVGPIRLLCAMESLLGLLLITWSASFTYLEMERYWRRG